MIGLERFSFQIRKLLTFTFLFDCSSVVLELSRELYTWPGLTLRQDSHFLSELWLAAMHIPQRKDVLVRRSHHRWQSRTGRAGHLPDSTWELIRCLGLGPAWKLSGSCGRLLRNTIP